MMRKVQVAPNNSPDHKTSCQTVVSKITGYHTDELLITANNVPGTAHS
jgi:hypothetical protein